jgi:hypothetical protein
MWTDAGCYRTSWGANLICFTNPFICLFALVPSECNYMDLVRTTPQGPVPAHS